MKNTVNNLINRIDQKFRPPFGPADYGLLTEPEDALTRTFPNFQDHLETFRSETDQIFSLLKFDIDFPSTSDISLICLTYTVVRLLQPHHVIETGVWIGSSSLTILSALKANGNTEARLHSIDLPPVRMENRVAVGRVVPEELRTNWNLCLGSSTEILPKLLRSIPTLDLFIHDSDHTYRNITFELRSAWPYLRPGGIMIIDDAHTNRASIKFAESVGCEPILIKRRKGGCIAVIQKT